MCGIAAAGVALHFATHPIPHQQLGWRAPDELPARYQLQTGFFISTAFALLTVLVGAIQLRHAGSEDSSQRSASQDEPPCSARWVS
jgi:hypothetical protein